MTKFGKTLITGLAISWVFPTVAMAEPEQWVSLSQASAAKSAPEQEAIPADVEGSQGDTSNQAAQQELFQYIEQLREEIQLLRGMVEEQAFQIRKMESEQRERYLDLDRRITSMGQGTSSNAAPTNNRGSIEDQQASYREATKLIREKKYPEAVSALKSFISTYPNTGLTPNAHYWLGEVYLVLPDYEAARGAFQLVVSQYPEHRKVPDAKYKLGVTYDRMGNKELAKTTLQKVVDEYRKSSPTVVRLAQSYLRRL